MYIILIMHLLDLLLTEMVYLQVARILLFVYMFYHVYLHFDQVITIKTLNLKIIWFVVLYMLQILTSTFGVLKFRIYLYILI
jgi:hypothetical protein